MPRKPADSTTAQPNIWAVGDLQGCYSALEALLNHPEIKNDHTCKIWFVGDIINRGPNSLAVLKRIIKLGDKAVTILGNHDLHLLAVYAGIRQQNKSDTINDILKSKNVDSYIDWLRHRPLAHFEDNHLMVHAGVMAQWDVEKTLDLADEVAVALRSDKWRQKLQKMYGNEPNQWNDKLKGSKRRRVIINALTRMRMCYPDGAMEFASKGSPRSTQNGLMPWFELPHRKAANTTIVFGHWSTLGLLMRRHLLSLDTGYVWGGALSAVHLGDRRLIQIPAK